MPLYTGPEQHMEPLTTQQEVSLVSDDQTADVEVDENEGHKQDDGSLDDRTGTYKDSSSSPEFLDAPERVGDDSIVHSLTDHDVKYSSSDTDVLNNMSTRENLEYKSTIDAKSIDLDNDIESKSYNLLEPGNSNESFLASGYKELDSDLPLGTTEFTSEHKENPVNDRKTDLSVSDVIPSKLSLHNQDDFSGSSEDQNSSLTLGSSSSINQPNEPVVLNESLSTQSRKILEPHNLAKDNIGTVASSSSNEDIDLGKVPQVSAEGHSSPLEVHRIGEGGASGMSVSASEHSFSNEKHTKSHNDITKGTSESPNPGYSFSSAGIPAPSVVSAALQVLPGKVLVPAVVDQVQGQALAALQVLKVLFT